MKKFLIIFLVLPLSLIAELKEEIFCNIALSVELGDFEESLNLAKFWKANFPSDSISAKACVSLFLLINNNTSEAVKIFNNIKDSLDDEVEPELKNYYIKIFEPFLTEKLSLTKNSPQSTDPSYMCKFRGWQIKSVFGAALYTAGLFIAPFSPAVGGSIITTALGLMFDSALGCMDECEDRKQDTERKQYEEYRKERRQEREKLRRKHNAYFLTGN